MLFIATNRLTAAEPLLQRALEIDERSCGPDHPNVAIRLCNLAGLMGATNRLAKAKLLFARSIVILMKFFSATGHNHPNFETALARFSYLLRQMGLNQKEIKNQISALASIAGVDPRGFSDV